MRLDPADARDVVKRMLYKHRLDVRWRDERHGSAEPSELRWLLFGGLLFLMFRGRYRIGVTITPHDGGCTISLGGEDCTLLGARRMERKLRLLDSAFRTLFEQGGALLGATEG